MYLNKLNWCEIVKSSSVNEDFKAFHETMQYYYDLAFSKALKKHGVSPDTSEVTPNILYSSNKLRELFYKDKPLKTSHCWTIHKQYHSEHRKIIVTTKK